MAVFRSRLAMTFNSTLPRRDGLLCAGALLSLLFSALPLERCTASESVLSQVRGVKNVSVPLGNVDGLPTVIFRCSQIEAEKRRLGFLSLGIFPRYIFRGVAIEVTGRGSPDQWLDDLNNFVSVEQFFRLGRVDKLRVGHLATGASIEAEQAGISESASGRQIHLRRVVQRYSDGRVVRLPEAAVILGHKGNEAKGLTATQNTINDPRDVSLTVISLQ